MYPLEHVYSRDAFNAWAHGSGVDLKKFRQSSSEISEGPFWDVSSWDDVRAAVSFLTLMNKRAVLYFRGQSAHFEKCLPVLFRNEWFCGTERRTLSPENRGKYYLKLFDLRQDVLRIAKEVGTPRTYILGHVPAAAASILQHYELWPTHFIDVTRSLSTAVAFAEGNGKRQEAFLYVFGMPDLRGSITSDIDQHLTLCRLEAICPPGAKRPHHQDAYLVSRFPEPPGSSGPGDADWNDWEAGTDLMRRLVAKFRLKLHDGNLEGAPSIGLSFLIPDQDEFGRKLREALLPIVQEHARTFD